MTADDGLALQSTSPAINAGTAAGAPATDILSAARTGNPDQGAYEFNPCVTPTAYTVTGGGGYCAGGSGVAVGLAGSESGVSYQLKRDGNNVGNAEAGTGSAIGFGTFTTAGTYTVLASRSETCTATMTGSAVVIVNPAPVLSLVGASPNPVCEGSLLSLSATASGGTGTLSYAWSGPNSFSASTNPASRTVGNSDGGVYSVVVSDQNNCQTSGQTASVSVSPPPTSLPAPTLTVGLVICAGQTLSVGVASVDCASGLTAQLSDKSGDFTTPSASWSVSAGSNSLTLPLGLPSGTAYLVRLVSTEPALTSPLSEAFTVTALGVAQLTTPSKICQGDALPVSFSIGGSCPFPNGNAFTVQLSSATGSFANPRILGTAQPGTTTFPASLLAGLSAGTGYRVRIVTTNPATTSSASVPFRLESPNLALTPSVGGATVCRGVTNALTVSFTLASCPFFEGNAFTAQLSSSSGSFNNPTTLGTVLAGQASPLTIPAGTAVGSGYRIRIVSSNPATTSTSSSPFQVRACTSRMSAEEAELVIAPNPVVGNEIRVRVSGMGSPTFNLTTTTGRSLGISVKTDGSGEFVLTPKQVLTAGVYAVQVSEGSLRLTQRVLVAE